MKSTISGSILLFISMLLLSSCGFHLRGMIHVPKWFNNIAIISENNDKQLTAILKSQLKGYKIQINDDPALAQYWLIINEVNLQQQIVSIGSSTNPRQYTLILTVKFMLKTHKGQVINTTGTVSSTRQLTLNNDRILGSNDEENILIGEMKQDIVTQIINRLVKPKKHG